MRHDDDIERLLIETPSPRLVAGPHRDYLKARLLEFMQEESSEMNTKTKTWRTGLAAMLAVLVMSAGGWAAHDVLFGAFVVEEEIGEPVVNEDGSVSQTSRIVSIQSNDPEFKQADADRDWEQIKTSIELGLYQLVDVQVTETGPVYNYLVLLEGGELTGYGTNEPLPELKPGREKD